MVGAKVSPEEYRRAAETVDGPFTVAISRLAASHRMAVVLPLYRIDAAGLLRNSAVVIDKAGRVAGCYDKVHPTRAEMDPNGFRIDRRPDTYGVLVEAKSPALMATARGRA